MEAQRMGVACPGYMGSVRAGTKPNTVNIKASLTFPYFCYKTYLKKMGDVKLYYFICGQMKQGNLKQDREKPGKFLCCCGQLKNQRTGQGSSGHSVMILFEQILQEDHECQRTSYIFKYGCGFEYGYR